MKGNEQDVVLTARKKLPMQFIKGIKSNMMLERMNGLRGHVSSADVHMKEMDTADDEKICNAL